MKAETYVVEVVLNDHSDAESVRVLDDRTKAPVFEFFTVDPITGLRACPAAVRRVAMQFRDIVLDHPLILPRHPLKRFALEHFQALA